jgi:predicted nucleic acid-binding protein
MVTPRYYFDANALFKYYQEELGSLKIRRLVANASDPILVSSLTVLEYFNIVLQCRRKNYFRNRQVNQVFKQLKREAGVNSTHRPFQVVPFSEEVFPLAESILFEYARVLQIGSLDALHLAMVKRLQVSLSAVVMVTSDQSMQKVCERLGMLVYDPETD